MNVPFVLGSLFVLHTNDFTSFYDYIFAACTLLLFTELVFFGQGNYLSFQFRFYQRYTKERFRNPATFHFSETTIIRCIETNNEIIKTETIGIQFGNLIIINKMINILVVSWFQICDLRTHIFDKAKINCCWFYEF